MSDHNQRLADLRRPRLLISAARFGMSDYSRERDLKRLFGGEARLSTAIALDRLMEAEAAAEGERTSGSATYSVARHVELLIALMAEARLQLSCP